MSGSGAVWLRRTPFEVSSAYPADVLLRRCAGALGARVGPASKRLAVGSVDGVTVEVAARRRGAPNAWRPVFRGEVEPAGTGSVLRGHLYRPLATNIATGVWFALLLCSVALAALVAGLSVADGDRRQAGLALHGIGAGLGLAGLAIGVSLLGMLLAEGDEIFVRRWLRQCGGDEAAWAQR